MNKRRCRVVELLVQSLQEWRSLEQAQVQYFDWRWRDTDVWSKVISVKDHRDDREEFEE